MYGNNKCMHECAEGKDESMMKETRRGGKSPSLGNRE